MTKKHIKQWLACFKYINSPYLPKILFILLFISCSPALSHVKDVDESQKLHFLIEENFSSQFDFSYLVEQNGKIINQGYSGYTDKKKEQEVNSQTIYNLASIYKAIIAIAIMKLVEEEKINLNTTLGQLFKNIPQELAVITIQQLITHKSGFPNDYVAEGEEESKEVLKTIFNLKLTSSPGSSFTYANANYQLLSLIIEKISQQSIEDHLDEVLLHPLEMNDTYFWKDITHEMNIVRTKRRISKKFGKRDWGYSPVFSTAEDLLKFWNAIYKNGFLTESSKNTLLNSYHETSSGLQIGFGFYTKQKTKWETPEIYTRGTESWGHNAVIRYFPEKRTTIIVLTNSGEFGKNKMTGNKILSSFIANYLFK